MPAAVTLQSRQPHPQPNRLPIGVVLPLPSKLDDMTKEVPACFERGAWVMWLSDTWHKPLDNARERSAMLRGVVPNFCAECTACHRDEMTALGRCERAAGLLEDAKP